MSQSNTGQAQAAETLTQETKTFIRQVRTKTRRKYAPEDKIRIVLEVFRREVTVSDLPTRGDQAGRILCLDQGIYGSGERASHQRHGERRHPSGD